MKELLSKINDFLKNRDSILISLCIIISAIYIVTLFNLQVVNGKEYREKSDKKILRNEKIYAARGEIHDSKGVVLASNKLSYDLVIYRTKIDIKRQNEGILNAINILNENNDKVTSSFPINDKHDNFNFKNKDEELKWKSDFKFDSSFSFDDIIDRYIYRYSLEEYNREDAINIIMVRYEASLFGYSFFNCVTIAEDISEESLAKLSESSYKLYGIEVKPSVRRYYPYEDLFAHTIGYVSKINRDEYKKLKDKGYSYNSYIGKTGIEQSYEKYLVGKDGIKRREVDLEGFVSKEYEEKSPVKGNTINLTLDYRLQKVANDSLIKVINDIQNGNNSYIKSKEARSGSTIVLDAKNSEVLALVNYPSFNPNRLDNINYYNYLINSDLNPMYNRAISGKYSPGSTFKMLVSVAGLETGKISKDEKIETKGIYDKGHKPKCWIYDKYKLNHGSINVSEAIMHSCNYFFYELGYRIGIKTIIDYAYKFGLNSKTGIDILGENTGNTAGDGVKEWYLGQTLSASIGQENSNYTLIELANYISTIANGGNLNRVKLVKSIHNDNNDYIDSDEIRNHIEEFTNVKFEEKKLDFKEENLEAVKYGMLLVTKKGGTSYRTFKDVPIDVAGKTGTAETPSGNSNSIFVGFAPYDNPEIVVVSIIEHGGEGIYVADAVKPIILEYFKMNKEDKLSEKKQNISENNILF